MILDPRAIALQGIGYAPLLIAVQGVGEAAAVTDWVTENARSYNKRRRRDYNEVDRGENVDWARRALIDEEDEIVLAVIMAAAPLLGAHAWRQ